MMIKPFVIRCSSCNWKEITTGITEDLKHLTEVKTCVSCKGRLFKCPKCGQRAKMNRILGNT